MASQPSSDSKPSATAESISTSYISFYSDVSDTDWFADAARFVTARGLMNGVGDGKFAPRTLMSRGMLVTVLAKYAGVDFSKNTASGFNDVDNSQYYAASIGWAKKAGLVSGTGGGKFSPDACITRQDLAVIITGFAKYAKLELDPVRNYEHFNDSDKVSGYAAGAVETLYTSGIVNGKPGLLFDPKAGVTRAEAAAILHRFILAVE
jgi:hypothetical protein